jgi:20S proteasome subunit alpha 6
MEAVKQGSAAVGAKSDSHVVLATLKRTSSELSSHQQKLFKVDEHVGVAIAGLMADARVLTGFIQGECLNHRYVFDSAMPVGRLANKVAEKSQGKTMKAGKRPYGVGLLIAGYDDTGAHLYQTCPSANIYDLYGVAIGGRAQSAKTYLEKHFASFAACGEEELIRHALKALKETATEGDLTSKNTAVAVVGKDTPYYEVPAARIQAHLDAMANEQMQL